MNALFSGEGLLRLNLVAVLLNWGAGTFSAAALTHPEDSPLFTNSRTRRKGYLLIQIFLYENLNQSGVGLGRPSFAGDGAIGPGGNQFWPRARGFAPLCQLHPQRLQRDGGA